MQVLSRGGRTTAPNGASRPNSIHAIQLNNNICGALLLPEDMKRERVVASAASRRKAYQDQGSRDSLDLDSMDELDEGKLGRYVELTSKKAVVGSAGATAGIGNLRGGNVRGGNGAVETSQQQSAISAKTKTSTQQAPPAPARAPPGPGIFEDFSFDVNWGTQPLPPSGGGYMNGGGYGGYQSGGSGGGYMNDSGYGGGYGGNYAGGYSGGYTGYGNSGGYINSGYGGGYGAKRNNRIRNGSMRMMEDFSDDLDDIDGEMPVVKVASCVINGKTLQCNHGITVREVYLLGSGPDRVPLGVMPTARAQGLADEAKEDLLLINPDASPPVARIIQWSKYKYELDKTAKEKKAKSTSQETKEVRLRPSTDSGDIAVKIKSCAKFLSKGDRVKLVMKFEGRELHFKEQGKEVLLNLISELASVAKVDGPLNFKTGTYTIILMPNKP